MTLTTIVILIITSALISGLGVWLVSSRGRERRWADRIAPIEKECSDRVLELEGEVKGAGAVIAELRNQITGRETVERDIRQELDGERQARVEAVTKLQEASRSFEEQKALMDALKKEMTDTFNALSSAALKSSSEDFLRLASESLGKVAAETKGKLGEHKAAMDGMIKPLFETLKRYEEQIKAMEDSRHKAYGSLSEQLRTLASTHESLQKETGNLVSALRKPQVRGRWGEMQLRRVAELSGMSVHCDFTEQHSVDTEKGRIRPDMIVHLPMERDIIVDSKVSLEAYLDAVAASTDEEKRAAMVRHAQQVRTHMNKLGSKEYWSQFDRSPEFVVLFIPGESFLSAALEVDGALLEEGMQKRVIIATPTTFIALLRAIAYGWRQERLTKNAQEISSLGRELYERIGTLGKYFAEMGAAIEKTIGAYNRIIGSMEARVLPSVRRFRELGATGGEEIKVLEEIDHKPRSSDLLEGLKEE